jgi:hypothetical protein
MFDWIFDYFGVKAASLAAGAAGGGVRALLIRGDFYSSIVAVVTGIFAAAYLTTPIYAMLLRYTALPVEQALERSVSFLVGLTGLFLCEGVLLWAKRWASNPSLKNKA